MTDLKNLTKLTIKEAQKGLQKKDFSAQELTQGCLQRIDEKEDDLNAFITVTPVKAIEQAKAVDELLDKDVDLPPLAGIPLAIKDNICIEDVRTTAGSQILENFVSPYDATVISKLRKQKAVLLGKTNMDEFAMGSSTEHSAFGPTKNPYDKRKVPGGSSGGSAVAVESGMCLGALGSDTGGSIRQPASFCGVVGLKPTYGAVSRYGLIALTSSLDQIGPLTKTVEDSVLLYNALVGKDERDATTIDSKEVDLQEIGFSDLKIGYSPDQLKQLDKEMRSAYQQILEHCEGHGAEIVKVNLPNEKYATAVYYLVTPSEASANLARYDGIRYGTRISGDTFRETFIKSRSEGLGEEVKRRIMLGTYVLSAVYYDDYFLKASKVRTLILQDYSNAFAEVDVILGPTTPTPAFGLGEKRDPLSMYLADIFTIPANLAGICGLSMPCGKIDDMPIGLQILGNQKQEQKIFAAAKLLEETGVRK